MFHRRTDASKVALVHLVDLLSDDHRRLLDVQWRTPHLASLGVTAIPRAHYADLLHTALEAPKPDVFRNPPDGPLRHSAPPLLR